MENKTVKSSVKSSIICHWISLERWVQDLLLKVSCEFDSRRRCHEKNAVSSYFIGIYSFYLDIALFTNLECIVFNYDEDFF